MHDLITEIWNVSSHEEIVLDFSTLTWAFPFGALLLANELTYHFEMTGMPMQCEGYENQTYLAHIGFFKLAQFNIGNEPGEAKGGAKYIPITVIDKNMLCSTQVDLEMTLGRQPNLFETIQDISDRMSRMILPESSSDSVLTVSYCFREIIRNVFEHANVNKCTLFAQAYDFSDKPREVRIVIADKGCGLLESLNRKYSYKTDEEAIIAAIQPGISGADTSGIEEWSNSGFGLYVLSELGKRYGSLNLCSGRKSLLIRKLKSDQFRDVNYQGTAVELCVSLDNELLRPDSVEIIVKEGEKTAEYAGRPRKASSSSKRSQAKLYTK